METILRANRVPFKAVDIAVDDKARMLWGRRAGKDDAGRLRKLPGLVQEGLVIGVSTPLSKKLQSDCSHFSLYGKHTNMIRV